MVGNDVVDLLDPEARPAACHARFDARVFASEERDELRASATPGRLRWLLWAAKEAAYKAAKKEDSRTVFAPRAFVVRTTRDGRRVVEHEDGRRFALRVDLAHDHVHVTATSGPAPDGVLLSQVERLPAGTAQCPGAAARALALARVAPHVCARASDLAILKSGRGGKVPLLVRQDGSTVGDLSLSHHGRFVAFACELPGEARAAGSVA